MINFVNKQLQKFTKALQIAQSRLPLVNWRLSSHRKMDTTDPQLRQYSNDYNEDALYAEIDVNAMMGQQGQEEDGEEGQGAIVFSEEDDEDDEEIDPDDVDVLAFFTDDENEPFEDEDEDDFMDVVREASKSRKRRKTNRKRHTGGRAERELDPEILGMLSEGNAAFVQRDFETAEKAYLEVIKKDPKNFSAYKALGEIYLVLGEKNKSCNTWFLAAHIKPFDGEFWAVVADTSRELGHTAQALYCYGRAISAGYKDLHVFMDRAILYRETGQLGRASESLQKLQETFPQEQSVLRELALIYKQLNRINDAIAMYLKVFEKNVSYRKKVANHENAERDFPVFDWSSLNILSELFVNQKNYVIAIRTIKHIARWIQERESQDFWEDVTDDSEFDQRRYENTRYEALPDVYKTQSHRLPIDIRIKLGSLRLHLGDVDEALIHYGFLLNDDISDTTDLYHEAAVKLEEAQLFGDAVKFYQPLSRLEEYATQPIFTSLGKCHTELGNYEKAKESYMIALEMDPENVDIQLALVEVLYYLEEVEESQALLEAVSKKRRRVDADGDHLIDNELRGNVSDLNDDEQALIANKIIKPPKRGSRLTEAEKQAREDRIKQNVIDKYNRLQRLHQGLEAGDPVAAGTWIQLAAELIEIFSNVKNFFPKDRLRQFKGIITRTKGLQMDVDSKIERISQLYEGFTSKLEEKVVLTSKEEFKGLTYEQWFDLFMQYALAVAKLENPYDAISVIENAKNVNVFYQDKERDRLMNLVKLAITIRTRDQKEILSSLRSVLNGYQFNKKILKLFLLAQPSGKLCTENFISINHQKYFLRQIKGYDSIKLGKSIPGMATIANKEVDPKGRDNVYLMYIYACLLFTNRSYVPSLVYFTRIYKSHKEEPIVCLLSGLAHVHRSMQRSSPNRHLELLQGMKYIWEYYELRTSERFTRLEEQEALYNVARVFHLLGLFSIAVEYYNKVLDFEDLDIEVDLKRQTAYNLTLIYNNSCNTRLSNYLMNKYLTI